MTASPHEGPRAMVGGGTHGIGLAIAEELVQRGARVVVTGRDASKASAAQARLGAAETVLVGDVTDPAHPALAPRVRPGGGSVFTTLTAKPAAADEAVTLATKAAVRAFSRSLAADLVWRDVRDNRAARYARGGRSRRDRPGARGDLHDGKRTAGGRRPLRDRRAGVRGGWEGSWVERSDRRARTSSRREEH